MRGLIRSLIAVLAILLSPISVPVRAAIEPAIPSVEDAPIALLVDVSSGQTLYSREADRRFVPASMTKVMTVMVAFDLIDSGKVSPNRVLTMSDAAYKEWHGVGSTMFLEHRQQVTVDQLLHGITTVSANDGAIVLAEGLAGSVDKWVAMMNATARRIGMHDSHYGRPNGWMDDGQTFVTAHDLALLASAMIRQHPELYHRYFGHREFDFNGLHQYNHDPVTGIVKGADGIKTGFTNQAGYGFLGSAERDGQRLVMVVANAPTGRARNRASRELLEWGFDAFDHRKFFANGAQVGSARVQNGSASSVGLAVQGPVTVALPKGSDPKVRLAIRYQGPLRAPIDKGEEVAELTIKVDGMPISAVPLIATRTVGKAGIFRRLVNGVAGLF
ncbi:D-alanyl-D-alanine carboxypeptidase family protein [Tsuneonella mangrovi]|uniref:D-alanyl-D-alanine carboxypeptidase family protein n=1 Tax=Tsuneonella mangrovi TaxID=1982042 RepID=UPI00123784DA|nr:D-alanyl-D-alanine carboxypeptidase family protein [Tsuneonella mangrovi]